jgi:hypothetical protein
MFGFCSTQFFVLALELLDVLRPRRRHTLAHIGVDFPAPNPGRQRLRHAANLERNRVERRRNLQYSTSCSNMIVRRACAPQVRTRSTCSWRDLLKGLSVVETRGDLASRRHPR